MRPIRLPQFQNVGPNQRVSLSLPLGVTYQKLYLQLGTNILTSLISNIVLRINNKEFARWSTAADLIALNAYKGNYTGSTAFLALDGSFPRTWGTTPFKKWMERSGRDWYLCHICGKPHSLYFTHGFSLNTALKTLMVFR